MRSFEKKYQSVKTVRICSINIQVQ